MKMNKVILIMLLLLPFDVVFAESEPYPEQYWIDDDTVRGWSKKEGGIPVKEGDYIMAEAEYALRYCNGELTHLMTKSSTTSNYKHSKSSMQTFEYVIYICRYNGKPIRLTETIFSPTSKY